MVKLPDIVEEIDRIVGIKRDYRSPDRPEEFDSLIRSMTSTFRKSGSDWVLKPAQVLTLDALHQNRKSNRGAMALLGVGHGKTLIAQLASKVRGIPGEKTLVFVPANARKPFYREMRKYQKHFDVATDLIVLSYTQLSQRDGWKLLNQIDPKLIILDEAHYVSHLDSARTGRLIRYFQQNPDTACLAMSGTLTRHSIKDYSHLAEITLRRECPIPLRKSELENWSFTLDVDTPVRFPRVFHWVKMQRLYNAFKDPDDPAKSLINIPVTERKEVLRRAFFNRLQSAPGVILTKKSPISASLYLTHITNRHLPPCPKVEAALARAEKLWVLPCGEEIDSPLDMGRVRRQLARGFYLRWIWPDGEPDFDWLYARRKFARQVYRVIKYGPALLDTPGRVIWALEEGKLAYNEPLTEAWERWRPMKDRPEPPTEPVWISDYFIDHLAGLIQALPEPALIWYSNPCVIKRFLNKHPGLINVVWPGETIPDIHRHTGLSVHSFRESQNLQAWGFNIVCSSPSSSDRWEQVLGRTYRHGQERDELHCYVYTHTRVFKRAIKKAKTRARYVETTTGQAQMLLFAMELNLDEDQILSFGDAA